MFPILLSLGPITIYTANLLYIVGWCLFSFLFWRYLRSHGVLEERIFDLTFYSTLAALIGARLGFVFLFPKLFAPSLLLIGAFWVQPGLWLYAGLFSMFLAFFLYSKRVNIRLSLVFDAFIAALPWALLPIVLGIFLQGEEIGKQSPFSWGIHYPHADGIRHPVQLYELVVFFLIGLISARLAKKSVEAKWQGGLLGTLLLVLITPLLFALEFLKVGPLYLYGITINQWLLIIIFAESFGIVFTKGKGLQKIRLFIGGMYARFNSAIRNGSKKQSDQGTNTTSDDNSGTESSGPVSGS